jgi:hypothetical protein
MLSVLGQDRIHLVFGVFRLEVGMVLMLEGPFLQGRLRFDPMGGVAHFGE